VTPSPATARRHGIPILTLAIAIVAGGFVGSAATLLVCVLALPIIAWRYDNPTGAFFPLAVLFVLAVAILIVLMGLVAVVHGR